ncbi:bifunctional phosphoribosyl-AMP cyclohydrolase/phosphoribosyl-ATP diphosphatase HisIE [Fodinisporobacter ferrooxydans]|uniref:Histidine biosynthesis bifunctional protein HisIE n=1 Tax=Fodinisporobacter ferrooxydans TaxID=2901836 RepID=A0ABY4CMV5_9BACL|nr:bifunctional phosphoribosyl-AMP cyclohydrolase/phosphoribosyl-ATP diphosphatase HisIE [Alicyclobacillaceae bacterium MYW30-H2]
MNALQQLKFDPVSGLLPAIVQDAQSKQVLMLAYMNQESLDKTVETGTTWFWSRSRQALWNKGETSGHVQQVVSISYDCDGDTLLVLVNQTGPACHEGTYSCFSHLLTNQDGNSGVQNHSDIRYSDVYGILPELAELIAERDAERPEGAYTTYLFEKGLDKILKKVGEETTEVVIAAKNQDNQELRYEVSDLIYHLLVLLRHSKLPLTDVLQELRNRHDRQSAKQK